MEKTNVLGMQVPTNVLWGVGGLVVGAVAMSMFSKRAMAYTNKSVPINPQGGNPDTFGTQEVVLDNPLTPATGVVTVRSNIAV